MDLTLPRPSLRRWIGAILTGVLMACSSASPGPSAPAPPSQSIQDRSHALGAWRNTDDGLGDFVFDGETATLWLMSEKDYMWRTPDEHYRVKARWSDRDLEYLPPFGARWEKLASLGPEGFEGFERLDVTGALDAMQMALLTPRAAHDYTVKAMDEWGQPAPAHLKHWPGLSLRQGDDLIDAPEGDVRVARSYPQWLDRGELSGCLRVSISTARIVVRVGEPVRVLHVVEAVDKNCDAFIMGPKPAFGEHVDGRLVTREPELPDYPWVGVYDGAVLGGPNPDYNFEVTEYRFDKPGVHEIQWRPGGYSSNALRVVVVP